MALPSKLGRLAVKAQASSWGTAETTFASTTYLEPEGLILPNLVTEALRTDVFRPSFTEPETVAGSKAGVEVSFSFPMHGWSSATPSANPTVYHPDALLIENALRGSTIVATGYTTALAAGASDATTKYTDGAASTNWEGSAQLIPYASGRTVAWIKDIDTTTSPDSGTCFEVLAAHSATGTMYGSLVSFLATTQPGPLSLQWLGVSDGLAVTFFDGVVTKCTVTLQAKKQPKCDVTMRFLNWTPVGTGGAPASYVYDFPQMPPVTGANGAYKTEAGASDTAWRNFSSAVINIEVTTSDSECASSNQGADSIVVTDRRVTVEVIEPYVEATRTFTDWTATTPGTDNNELVIVANTTPGRAFAALIPESVVLEQTNIQDRGGIIAVRRLFGCRPYSGDGGTGFGAGNSPFRIAFL